MSQFHTRILPLQKTDESTRPNDFGLEFKDAVLPTFHDPCESLDIAFTSNVTRESMNAAAQEIQSGGLVAFPTETVYGLGACALRSDAAERIYSAKNRPADNPLIVHISDRRMMSQILPKDYQVNKACDALMKAFWPGPLTLLFPVGRSDTNEPLVPSTVTCGQPTVGLRMPSHPVARALIGISGVPIAAPSANASGKPSPTTAQHVMDDLGERQVLRYILDGGKCNIGLESTVVDATTAPEEVRVLRPGGVSVEQLSYELSQAGLQNLRVRVHGKDLVTTAAQEAAPTTPGMKYRHYSPEARVILIHISDDNACPSLQSIMQDVIAQTGKSRPTRVGVLSALDSPLVKLLGLSDLTAWALHASNEDRLSPVYSADHTQVCFYSLGRQATPEVAAQRLFDGLRTLDTCVSWNGESHICDVIFTDSLPEHGVGLAIMNRLKKAASKTVFIRNEMTINKH